MQCALTIAGSDPTGGAGIQADLRAFHTLGVHGMAVIAALTSQSTERVRGVYPVPGPEVESQLCALLEDIRPAALKTGMLYSSGAINAVAAAMNRYDLANLVIDPVAISSSGHRLLDSSAQKAMTDRLLPLARVVTPNLQEASWLTSKEVRDPEEMEKAARAIAEMGPEVVIITGGHLKDVAADMVFDGQQCHIIEGPMLPGKYHGTGCAFSACIAALLALGKTPLEAARQAKEIIAEGIGNAFRPGGGMSILRI